MNRKIVALMGFVGGMTLFSYIIYIIFIFQADSNSALPEEIQTKTEIKIIDSVLNVSLLHNNQFSVNGVELDYLQFRAYIESISKDSLIRIVKISTSSNMSIQDIDQLLDVCNSNGLNTQLIFGD